MTNPIAWRWRRKDDPQATWLLSEHDPAGFNTIGLEVEPLFLGNEIAKLREQLDKEQWKPIDTAPKDGNHILICRAETGDQMVVFYDEAPFSVPNHCWHRTDGIAYHRNFPSHWRPLPALPEVTLSDEEGK